MTPFKDLQNLADKIRDKTGKACCVSVEYWAHRNGENDLKYSIYLEDEDTQAFDSIKMLKAAMNDIINPPKDDGITLSE